MRIYFDMCSLQRPLDDQNQLRIRVETEAVLGVLSLVEFGDVELIGSEVLVFENDANPDVVRRDYAEQVMENALHFVETNDQIKIKAREFVTGGIKPLDALHLASAVEARANFFCTCDDRFLKKARALDTTPTVVVSPVELVSELQR